MDRNRTSLASMVQLLKEGSVSVPVAIFTGYKRLGLTESQVMLLLHILLFQEKEGKYFPTVNELADRMSLSADQLIECLQSLVRGGYLLIEEEVDTKGLRCERYSLTPLLSKLASLYLEGKQEATPAVEVPLQEDAYQNLFHIFEQEFGRPLSPMECETLSQWLDHDGYSSELITAALREAVFCNKVNFRYIDRILLEWQRNQIYTPEQAADYSRKFRQKGTLYQGEVKDKKISSSFSFYNWVKER